MNLIRKKLYDFLIIPSGPEPARTKFLRNLTYWAQKKEKGSVFAIINPMEVQVPGFATFISPTTKELGLLIAQSKQIISRAGYTTIMELDSLEVKSTLIPTPGQFEQLYLSEHV